MEEQDSWLWLSYVNEMWQGKMEILYEHFHSAKEIYKATEKEYKKVKGITKKDIESLLKGKRDINIGEIEKSLKRKRIEYTFYGDDKYPKRLYNIKNPPMVLFYKGRLPENNKMAAGIVGARICTEYGKSVAYELGKNLSVNNIDVISGMARGIDSMAHWGSIENKGCTYAILGCGVDVWYPVQNIELYEQIFETGGLISEYTPGTAPLAWHFPSRNRIISALSDSVVMVEAKEKSGSFITVDYALEQGKNVYALPGRINDLLSIGCNKLILEGAVPLISITQPAGDLIGEIKWENTGKKKFYLAKEFEMLYSCFGFMPMTAVQLSEKSGMEIDKVYEGIMYLQLEGAIKEVAKGQYVINGKM